MLKILDIMLKICYINDMKLFECRLREFRAVRGITQEQLAAEVGVVRQTIAYIERGEYMPSLGLAYKLARYFDSSIEEIFKLEKEINEYS